jgi:hypothetical protein
MESFSMQIAANRHMRDVLNAKGYAIGYSEYDGGHAFLNWSGGMARGLLFLYGKPSVLQTASARVSISPTAQGVIPGMLNGAGPACRPIASTGGMAFSTH